MFTNDTLHWSDSETNSFIEVLLQGIARIMLLMQRVWALFAYEHQSGSILKLIPP